jgi:hypothetical protein
MFPLRTGILQWSESSFRDLPVLDRLAILKKTRRDLSMDQRLWLAGCEEPEPDALAGLKDEDFFL